MGDGQQEQHVPALPMRTYTSLWQLERRLYKWWDWKLPIPISARMALVFFGTSVPWVLLLAVVGFPFNLSGWHIVWWLPPVVVTVAAGRPLAEGKTLNQLVMSRVKYWLRPRRYYRLRPAAKPKNVYSHAWVWNPDSAP